MKPLGSRVFWREFLPGMIAYAVVMPLSVLLIRANPDSLWRLPLALLPALPAFFVLLAVLHHTALLDELQRRIQLEGLAFAFVGTAFLTFTCGLLENAGLPRLSWVWVWPCMAALWGLGLLLAGRRYR